MRLAFFHDILATARPEGLLYFDDNVQWVKECGIVMSESSSRDIGLLRDQTDVMRARLGWAGGQGLTSMPRQAFGMACGSYTSTCFTTTRDEGSYA